MTGRPSEGADVDGSRAGTRDDYVNKSLREARIMQKTENAQVFRLLRQITSYKLIVKSTESGADMKPPVRLELS